MSRELTLDEIRQIGGRESSTRPRKTLNRAPQPTLPPCDHDWLPDFVITAKGEEYPTKRCTQCSVRIICQPNEIIQEVNIGEWLLT